MTEDLLREALHERADRTAYEPTPLAQVANAARAMRRRRRTTGVLVAAAAVIAITVPVAVVASRSAPDSAPVEPGPTEPVVTPDGTPPPSVEGGEAAPPRIAYAVDGEIINPDGRRVTLSGDLGISIFTPYNGGYLVAGDQHFEGSTYLTHYDASGDVLESWVGAGLAVGVDGATAWSSFSPPESGLFLRTLIHRDEATQRVDQIKPEVVGLIGQEVVYNGGGDAPQAWITDLVSAPRPVAPLRQAVDTAAGLVAGQVDDRTAAVVDAATGAELWREEGVHAVSLSPDGRYLHVMQDGLGGADTIRDARTGEVVVSGIRGTGLSGLPGLRITEWEDANHLLGTLEGDIVRVDLNGETAVAVPLGRQDILDVPFAAQP